jgi:SAM-dependent methyltransferase
MKCKICSSKQFDETYSGKIRTGGVNSGFETGYTIYKCHGCEVESLNPVPTRLDAFYESDDYWTKRFKDTDILEKIHNKLQEEQTRWLSEVGLNEVRNKNVADFGAGAGMFLDLVKAYAKSTIGIEPSQHLKDVIKERGHRHFNYSFDVPKNSVDCAVSFDTLEHIEDPILFINDIFTSLTEGGKLYIGVPNQDDFLKKLEPDYLPFFYHKSHLYYYNSKALRTVLTKAGFDVLETRYVHKYDIMNMVYWLKDRIGRGKTGGEVFDYHTERTFNENLERQGISSHILIVARKSQLPK